MQPPKGKPPTRGAQQIMKDNAETSYNFAYLAMCASGLRIVTSTSLAVAVHNLSFEDITIGSILSNVLIPVILLFLYLVINKISRPLYSKTGERKLISPGYDLNTKSGWGEHIRDIIMVLVLTHILTLIDNLFYLTLLLLPMRAMYVLWINFFCPLFLPQYTAIMEKKICYIANIIGAVVLFFSVYLMFHPHLHPWLQLY